MTGAQGRNGSAVAIKERNNPMLKEREKKFGWVVVVWSVENDDGSVTISVYFFVLFQKKIAFTGWVAPFSRLHPLGRVCMSPCPSNCREKAEPQKAPTGPS
ncbi:hypothetical protein OUZ56_031957 [Daphnia magna]|uniref:Uncharacterized protein n=1 Tax=Daphnia magna TaxID=35525 RepID=A0ABQ9ZVR3_9CRUS|nr:hypothetical protein OUZ56_031957 [Daphnia magna]